MQKIPPLSKTQTVYGTDKAMEVERADYAHPQPNSSTTPLAAGRLTHFQQTISNCSNNFRLPHTCYQSFISSTAKNYQSKVEEATKATWEYHRRTESQTSDTRSDRQFERSIHLNPVCCSAKEQNTHDLQLESTECIRGVNQIQDEMPAITTLYATRKRLHDEIRSQGCLLFKYNNETT